MRTWLLLGIALSVTSCATTHAFIGEDGIPRDVWDYMTKLGVVWRCPMKSECGRTNNMHGCAEWPACWPLHSPGRFSHVTEEWGRQFAVYDTDTAEQVLCLVAEKCDKDDKRRNPYFCFNLNRCLPKPEKAALRPE